MASNRDQSNSSATITVQLEDHISRINQILDQKKSLVSKIYWTPIEKCLSLLRAAIRVFFLYKFQSLQLPISHWAERLALSVADLVLTVAECTLNYLFTLMSEADMWYLSHEEAMKAWQENERGGLLAQTYAYAKRMASFWLEVFAQCFKRAIKAKGFEISEETKEKIAEVLKDKLGDE